MDITSIKKYIYDNNKIEYILDTIGCHAIKYNPIKDYYSASQPDGDNPMGVVIYNNSYLNYKSYSRNMGLDNESCDIVDLIEYCKKLSFIEALKYLHSILKLSFITSFQKKNNKAAIDPLYIFKQFDMPKTNVREIEYLNEDLMDYYVPLLYIGWLREGITQRTANKFGLAYSYKRKRVIIPIRDWLSGKLVGINQRTTIDNYEELGIKKYFITPHYQKGLNLYGLYENYDTIQKAGYVVVAESEKSVLKRDSLCDSTVVALSGHTISAEQIRILIGLNVEIIIALDNDIQLQEIRFICEKFYRIRPVSYMYDKWDLLKGEKDSPMDAENKIYNFMFKHRIKYNEEEHKNYIRGIRKGGKND